MDSLITLVSILTPLFIGFFIRLPKDKLIIIDRLLNSLVYIILFLIGISLSQVPDLGEQIGFIMQTAALLFVCVISMNLLVLIWFDRAFPWQTRYGSQGKKAQVSMMGSVKQVTCVLMGFIFGKILADIWLPPESSGTYALMLLILLVGMQLGSSGIQLKQVLINKRGVQTFVLITLSGLLGGVIFALITPEVPISQGLALASGFGWYSLSGIVMTKAYGAVWGSVALVNDLAREFFALLLIPLIMSRHPSAAVGVGGATSLDFTLPIIQSSGGLAVVPLAISYGFIINLAAPFLMLIFSTTSF